MPHDNPALATKTKSPRGGRGQSPWSNTIMLLVMAGLCLGLWFVPTGFENRLPTDAVQVKAKVVSVDDSQVHRFGIIREGDQRVVVVPQSGPLAGREITADNHLLGKLELDKIFAPGDTALVVLSMRDGTIISAVAQDHWRLGLQGLVLGLFVLALVAYAGMTGVRAVISFLFAALMLWKVLVPLLLHGHDPLVVTLGVLAGLMAGIVFLVGGLRRRSLAAYLGSVGGVAVTCLLALATAPGFALPGAVRPFAETLLYTGYGHLDLGRMFLATICLGASGAVMDVAMDVAASQAEVAAHDPTIGFWRLTLSGFRVGRVVVGTMATTLLLAYCGGSLALLLVVMAQGVPLVNVATMPHVAAEIANTLVGSFGLVTAAPLTALAGAALMGGGVPPAAREGLRPNSPGPSPPGALPLDPTGGHAPPDPLKGGIVIAPTPVGACRIFPHAALRRWRPWVRNRPGVRPALRPVSPGRFRTQRRTAAILTNSLRPSFPPSQGSGGIIPPAAGGIFLFISPVPPTNAGPYRCRLRRRRPCARVPPRLPGRRAGGSGYRSGRPPRSY